MIYPITPVPKPRQTRSDKWKKRPCVMRYRAFADEVRARGVKFPESGAKITFLVPMPKSWSKQKKEIYNHQPHQQTPDLDNLVKALLDAIYSSDSGVYSFSVRKCWSYEGAIEIL
ncbi:MAG: RusA family crossover junction endodeoxyribonuclease [bacterium]|nr:RusA family crossover junction endodeoxyribonuclease [bacterium]